MAFSDIFNWFQYLPTIVGLNYSNVQLNDSAKTDEIDNLNVRYSKHKTFKFEPMDKQKALEVIISANSSYDYLMTKQQVMDIQSKYTLATIQSEKMKKDKQNSILKMQDAKFTEKYAEKCCILAATIRDEIRDEIIKQFYNIKTKTRQKDQFSVLREQLSGRRHELRPCLRASPNNAIFVKSLKTRVRHEIGFKDVSTIYWDCHILNVKAYELVCKQIQLVCSEIESILIEKGFNNCKCSITISKDIYLYEFITDTKHRRNVKYNNYTVISFNINYDN